MTCHTCPHNQAPLKERQAHCPGCQITDVYPKPYYPIGEPYTEKVIEREAIQKQPDFADEIDGIDERLTGEADEAPAPDLATMDQVIKSEFVERFAKLSWRDQAVLLGVFKHGDCTPCIADMTRFAISTVWEHRKRLESDSFWGQWIRRCGSQLRKRRRGKSQRRRPVKTHDCNGQFVEATSATPRMTEGRLA